MLLHFGMLPESCVGAKPLPLWHNWSLAFASAWLMCTVKRHSTWTVSCDVINT